MGCDCEGCRGCGNVLGLAHIGVIVGDMQRSLEFYTGLLEFECYFKAEVGENGATKLAFLRRGTCEIELVKPPKGGERKDGAVDHIALLVRDLDAMIISLSQQGVKFEAERPMELPMLFENGVRCIFFHGPDGERIELSEKL